MVMYMGWEIEEERGGGAWWRGDSKGRRQEVGEIERRGGTLEKRIGEKEGRGERVPD